MRPESGLKKFCYCLKFAFMANLKLDDKKDSILLRYQKTKGKYSSSGFSLVQLAI